MDKEIKSSDRLKSGTSKTIFSLFFLFLDSVTSFNEAFS